MLTKHLPLALLLFCVFPETSHADSDNQVWSSAAFRYTSPQGLKLEATQHLRLDQNARSVLSWSGSVALSLDGVDRERNIRARHAA